jgi:hypothetical protein
MLRGAAAVLALCSLVFACADGPTGLEENSGPLLKKGGGGGKPESTPLVVTFHEYTGDRILSDGRGAYEHQVCGVRADFPLSGSGDVTMDPDYKRVGKKERETCGGARWLTTDFTNSVDDVEPGPVLYEGTFMVINEVETVTVDSGPVLRSAMFMVNYYCRLEFGAVPGSNMVEVSKNTDGTWTVRTQAFPNDVGYCADGVRGYHMPFEATISLPGG